MSLREMIVVLQIEAERARASGIDPDQVEVIMPAFADVFGVWERERLQPHQPPKYRAVLSIETEKEQQA
jgi:hypothetical protein